MAEGEQSGTGGAGEAGEGSRNGIFTGQASLMAQTGRNHVQAAPFPGTWPVPPFKW